MSAERGKAFVIANVLKCRAPHIVNKVLNFRYMPQRDLYGETLAEDVKNLWVEIRQINPEASDFRLALPVGARKSTFDFMANENGQLESFGINLEGPSGNYNLQIDYTGNNFFIDTKAGSHTCRYFL